MSRFTHFLSQYFGEQSCYKAILDFMQLWLPDQSGKHQSKIRQLPFSSGSCQIEIRLLSHRSGPWFVRSLTERDETGRCAKKVCHMSCVMCQVSHVRCHVSHVTFFSICFSVFFFFFSLCHRASLWRVCYQQGLAPSSL